MNRYLIPFVPLMPFSSWHFVLAVGYLHYLEPGLYMLLGSNEADDKGEKELALLQIHPLGPEIKGMWKYRTVGKTLEDKLVKGFHDALPTAPTFFMPGIVEKDDERLFKFFVRIVRGMGGGDAALEYIKRFYKDSGERVEEEHSDGWDLWGYPFRDDDVTLKIAREIVRLQTAEGVLEDEMDNWQKQYRWLERPDLELDLPYCAMYPFVKGFIKDF